MRDSDRLRDRSVRLFALALKALEDGKPDLTGEITRLAVEAADQANAMDQHEAPLEQSQGRREVQQQQLQQQQQQQQQRRPKSEQERPADSHSSGMDFPGRQESDK